MLCDLLSLVSGINVSEDMIPEEKVNEYMFNIDSLTSSDCCYGADCGDCDCGGYCIEPIVI